MEINIPSQRIRAKWKGGLINEGGVISSEYGIARWRHSYAIWPRNETICAHACKLKKWRPSKRSAAAVCCEWHDLSKLQVLKTLRIAGPAH